jgi:hypothetical protein
MTTRNVRLSAGLLALSFLTGGGCSSGPKLTEVEGTVTLNGKPLNNAQVQFLPDPEQGTSGPRSTGTTDEQGRFKLVSDDQRSGAVVGNHRVLVVDLKQWEGIRPGREDANKPLKPSRLPARYANGSTTPLKAEVKEGGPPIKVELQNP